MDIKEAMAFIHQTQYKGSKLGLENTRKLMDLLGNPQDKLKFIHIAGTNGKGSTSAMLAKIFEKAGYTTGLFTSPYINEFNERIQVNGKNIPDEALIRGVEKLKPAFDQMDDKPTEFEIITALGFLYFAEKNCDIVVLEVGLGGRLDSTNVIKTPVLDIITAIGLDHTKELGDTIEEIAWEKAGIIKEGSPVVLYDQDQKVLDLIRKTCQERGSKLYISEPEKIRVLDSSLDGQVFSYKDLENVRLNLLGAYQLKNLALVLKAIELLRVEGWDLPDEAIRSGLEEVSWPARFELVNKDPIFIVDGAHNVQGVKALRENLDVYFKDKKIIFLTGVMADKDYRHMYEEIAPLAKDFIVVRPENPRALGYHDLAVFLKDSFGIEVLEGLSVKDGIEKALDLAGPEDIIVAFGSLYMAGDLRAYFKEK